MAEIVSLTLTAAKEDYDLSLPGFLHEHPNTEKDPETGELVRTDAQHIKKWLEDYYYRESLHGLEQKAKEAVILNKVFG